MHPKLYQVQVIAGAALAGVLVLLDSSGAMDHDQALSELIEGASFLLCCAGILTGGRGIRNGYAALGSDKLRAIQSEEYMQQRRHFQLTALVACAAIALLLARQLGYSPLYALGGSVALGLLLPVINRASGWTQTKSG
jgi:O-antigen/teichoic acid export membrane protein